MIPALLLELDIDLVDQDADGLLSAGGLYGRRGSSAKFGQQESKSSNFP